MKRKILKYLLTKYYIFVYKKVDKIFKKYDICELNKNNICAYTRKLLKNNKNQKNILLRQGFTKEKIKKRFNRVLKTRCCYGYSEVCDHWSENGCLIKSLSCKLWYCGTNQEKNLMLYKKLHKWKFITKWICLYPRTPMEKDIYYLLFNNNNSIFKLIQLLYREYIIFPAKQKHWYYKLHYYKLHLIQKVKLFINTNNLRLLFKEYTYYPFKQWHWSYITNPLIRKKMEKKNVR